MEFYGQWRSEQRAELAGPSFLDLQNVNENIRLVIGNLNLGILAISIPDNYIHYSPQKNAATRGPV